MVPQAASDPHSRPSSPSEPLLKLGRPPYDRFGAWEDSGRATLSDGTVLVARVDRLSRPLRYPELQQLRGRAEAARRGRPGVVMAAAVGGATVEERERALRVLAAAGVGLLVEGEPTDGTLRTALAARGLRACDVDAWLVRRIRPRGAVEEGVVRIAARVAAGVEVDRWAARDARAWLPRLGLPPYRSWDALGRALAPVVALQADPKAPIDAMAKAHGFPDAPTFRHACGDRFGDPPSVLRKGVGWEWLLERWLTRMRARGRGRGSG